jgi:hypothetical protein
MPADPPAVLRAIGLPGQVLDVERGQLRARTAREADHEGGPITHPAQAVISWHSKSDIPLLP